MIYSRCDVTKLLLIRLLFYAVFVALNICVTRIVEIIINLAWFALWVCCSVYKTVHIYSCVIKNGSGGQKEEEERAKGLSSTTD